jgi:hypothetical protein
MATPDWIKKQLRAPASRGPRSAAGGGPRAVKARFITRGRALHVELSNGVAVRLPVDLIPDLKRATTREISSVEVSGRGGGLHWPSMDLDLSVPSLVSSAFEGRTWMAELGRLGGRQSSDAKAAAARKNGRKGGRPRMRPAAS